MSDVVVVPAKRDATGRFPPGVSGNPKGRAKELPDWFRAAGEPALKHLMAVSTGAEVDERVSRAECCFRLVERIYGKTPVAQEEQDIVANGFANIVSAIATGQHRRPPVVDVGGGGDVDG